jgi:hypothetical protein
MNYRKSPAEKEQKQKDMTRLETQYEQFLADKITEKRDFLREKYPQIKTLFEGWLYGVYVAILDAQELVDRKGKLYYLFENIPESNNKYKLAYTITEGNNCVFNVGAMKNLPKSYVDILKRHKFNTAREEAPIAELIAAHRYKLDDEVYVHHADYNGLNNNIDNLVPLEITFFKGLSEGEQKSLAKPHLHIPERYKVERKKKPKDVNKMEYRACDLYYNHKIPVEKVAATLRNRLNKAAVLRIVKLYPYFKIYSRHNDENLD